MSETISDTHLRYCPMAADGASNERPCGLQLPDIYIRQEQGKYH